MHRTFNSTGGPKANKTKTQTHLCTNYERQKPPNRQLNFQFEVEIQFDLNILFSADIWISKDQQIFGFMS